MADQNLEQRVLQAWVHGATDGIDFPPEVLLDQTAKIIFQIIKESSLFRGGTIPKEGFARRLRMLVSSPEDQRDILRSFLVMQQNPLNGGMNLADLEEIRVAYEERRMLQHIDLAMQALKGQVAFDGKVYSGVPGAKALLEPALVTRPTIEQHDPFSEYLRRKRNISKELLTPRLLCPLFPAMEPGELWVFFGFASDGKTSFALNIATALRPTPVLFLTLETTPLHAYWKTACLLSCDMPPRISYTDIKWGKLDDEKEKHFAKLLGEAYSFMRVEDCQPGMTEVKLVALFNSILNKQHYPVVFIDYLGLMAQRGKDYFSRLGELLKTLKRIAKENRITIVCLHQANRDGWGEAKKRGFYTMDALSDINEAERTSDAIAWILRTGYLKSRIGPAKYRDEPMNLEGFMEVTLDPETGRLEEGGAAPSEMRSQELNLDSVIGSDPSFTL